mgnify:CR=1 FL=1
MTPSVINQGKIAVEASMSDGNREQSNIFQIASLVAIGCVLQISESLIPHPVPGVRLGLANMITLLALVQLGFKSALEISVLRTVVSSLVMGTFLTPTFVLSFSGAITSTIIMWGFWWISYRLPKYGFGLVGISVLGAIIHNITQIIFAYYLLIKHPSIFYFLPWLILSGVVMGWLTGLVTIGVIKRLNAYSEDKNTVDNQSVPGNSSLRIQQAATGDSFLHRLAPEWKILGTIGLMVLILFVKHLWVYSVVMLSLVGLMVITRMPLSSYMLTLKKFRKLWSLILISFSFPILFSFGSNANAIFNLGPVQITEQGFMTGSIFGLRIICMLWVTFLLSEFTSPVNMAEGIRKVLAPFGFFGLPVKRLSSIISISWQSLPLFWDRARHTIRQEQALQSTNNKPAGLIARIRNLIPLLSNIITALYRQGEQVRLEAAKAQVAEGGRE